jgi:hypothetical protein
MSSIVQKTEIGDVAVLLYHKTARVEVRYQDKKILTTLEYPTLPEANDEYNMLCQLLIKLDVMRTG